MAVDETPAKALVPAKAAELPKISPSTNPALKITPGKVLVPTDAKRRI